MNLQKIIEETSEDLLRGVYGRHLDSICRGLVQGLIRILDSDIAQTGITLIQITLFGIIKNKVQ